MKKVRVSLSVDDEHLGDRFADVVARLEKAGLTDTEAHPAVGAISGVVDEAKLDAIAKVRGVGHVERERKVTLPPPDSGVQ